jgi:hypothetical protein
MVLPRYIVEGLKVAMRHLLDAAWRFFIYALLTNLKKFQKNPNKMAFSMPTT